MGGGWYTDERVEITWENKIADECDRIVRYCGYVETSLGHEPDSIVADYKEIVESCRAIGLKMTQLGTGVASVLRVRPKPT